jgi:predicted Zn finger-like uncharacterized protein
MTVTCPHCSVGYKLADHLLGPRGARVKCPRCGQAFVVLRDPEVGPVESAAESPERDARGPEAEAPEAKAPLTPAESDEVLGLPALSEAPEDVATRILDALADQLGDRLERARDAGRVWSELGRDLMRAWDEYREALGPRADAGSFRAVLRARWDVDLGTGLARD